jgi:hypothetical protein
VPDVQEDLAQQEDLWLRHLDFALSFMRLLIELGETCDLSRQPAMVFGLSKAILRELGCDLERCTR